MPDYKKMTHFHVTELDLVLNFFPQKPSVILDFQITNIMTLITIFFHSYYLSFIILHKVIKNIAPIKKKISCKNERLRKRT